ncbi:MAG: flavodoxin family protein [Thermoplasmatota archaeon]
MVSGSPRPRGNTAQVLERCADVIRGAGVEAEVTSLAGKRIQACTACRRCAELKRCVLRDDFDPIFEKVRRADGLIVGSPVYFGTARGDVMNLLQRIGMVNRAGERFLAGKVGGPIAIARRGSHTATLQEMLMFFLISDMIVPGSTYWNMVFGREPGEALSDREGMETVLHFAENVARLVKRL